MKARGAVIVGFGLLASACTREEDRTVREARPEMPAEISIGATDETLSLPFGLAVSGSALGFVGDIDVAANAGTIELDGEPVAVAFYEKQRWEKFGYTLYQGFAVTESRWDVVWLYCDEDGLAYVWDEGIGGRAIDYLAATGTCADSAAATSTHVTFPALTLAVPPPASGFTIDGEAIRLEDGEHGTLQVEGTALPFAVFSTIDCTACGGDGWYELHSLVWDEEAARATVVILYLELADPAHVFTAYARSLPDFTDPIGILEVGATWSAP